jgi:competence protein ComGF
VLLSGVCPYYLPYLPCKIKMFEFQNMFNFFKELLEDSNDIRRARFRRVIPPELLVEMSDMLNSIISKEKIKSYQKRTGQIIKI